ncbi:group-specific protein [Nostoc sp. 'Peltigera membranacea cyanobiont' 232]|uniref:group-specific protein n=1 Tax=Nostoc sp. 'Peltigera membranacea cyanobiont' 232 TaxID=2014531 RepID=UPI000B95513C|nr:group-specific protein [Nostoc sp. 'Peltigera membranacea cyanobiont' 232]OYE00429.1 group-specific protein [Nostoc sp. 'Peltigera membranacea cyanobiont' 232]
MTVLDGEEVVVVVRHKNRIRWFRCDRDLWVLDVNKWRADFISHGYEVPEFNDSFRYGIHAVNRENAQEFLDFMSKYEVNKDELSMELAKSYLSARSWWDVKDLFPIMFVNFENCKVGAFYPDGVPLERYLPDGWKGEFVDFANEYPDDIFPVEEKFWIKKGCDLLALLNKRGAEQS